MAILKPVFGNPKTIFVHLKTGFAKQKKNAFGISEPGFRPPENYVFRLSKQVFAHAKNSSFFDLKTTVCAP